jgi:hypothetical protein
MKNLDKFFNKADLPWVKLVWQNYYKNGQLPGRRKGGSFWWSIAKFLDSYKGIAEVEAGSSDTILF